MVPPEPVTGTAGSLREFVYLDEVSVYSLTSAPDMPPPVTMSESADTSTGEVLTSQIAGGAPLVAKASIGGELNSSRSQGLQVQRQFNIQSQFARLHRMYRPTFLLTANAPDTKIKRTSDLDDALRQLEAEQRAIRATNLTRGALAELRVSLRAHHTFDVTAFIRIMAGLIKKYPELLQIKDVSVIQTVMDGGEFLAELMEDLVPIEGRSTTHEIVTDRSGNSWVAEIDGLDSIYDGPLTAEPLRVVGVAETGSFWKDTRRILHAEAEFDVLGRVSRTGLQDEWTPVKMIDTFRRVIPHAASGLIGAVDQLKNISDETSRIVDPVVGLVLAGTKFNLDLANHHNVATTGPSPEMVTSLLADNGTMEGRLAALNEVADAFYANHVGLERDEDKLEPCGRRPGKAHNASWTCRQTRGRAYCLNRRRPSSNSSSSPCTGDLLALQPQHRIVRRVSVALELGGLLDARMNGPQYESTLGTSRRCILRTGSSGSRGSTARLSSSWAGPQPQGRGRTRGCWPSPKTCASTLVHSGTALHSSSASRITPRRKSPRCSSCGLALRTS